MGRKALTQNEVVERVKAINPNIKILGRYINNSTKIECECLIPNCKHKWMAIPYSLFQGYGCPRCGKKEQSAKLRRTTEQYKQELKDKNIQVECLGEYQNANIKILHKCLKHNVEWMARPSRVLNNETVCPKCKIETAHKIRLKSQDEFIEQLHKIHPYIDLIDIYDGGDNKHRFKCRKCNHIWNVMPRQLIDNTNPTGCPLCASSKLEKKIKQYFDDNNIIYKQQYRISKCRHKRPLAFDFAVFIDNKLLCLIEADGQQHFKPVCFAGMSEEQAEKNFKQQKIRDNIKNKYCQENNIILLRISYLDINNIEDYLIDKLNNIIGSDYFGKTQGQYKEKTCA